MYTFLIIVYLIICLLLTLVVLLQSGKGAGMGVAFGGASATMFGGSGGANFLSKITAWFSVSFIVISIILARMSIPDKPNVKCEPNKWVCEDGDKAKKKRKRCDAQGSKYIRTDVCEWGCNDGLCKVKPQETKKTPKKIELKKLTPEKDASKKDAKPKDIGKAPKTVAPKKDAPKTVAPKKDAPKSVAPKKDAPKSVAPKSVAPKSVAPKTVAPKTVAPKP